MDDKRTIIVADPNIAIKTDTPQNTLDLSPVDSGWLQENIRVTAVRGRTIEMTIGYGDDERKFEVTLPDMEDK